MYKSQCNKQTSHSVSFDIEYIWVWVWGGGRRGRGGRLLNFSAFRMGAYSRWALIRGWALIRINTVYWQPWGSVKGSLVQVRREIWLKLCGDASSSPQNKLVPQDRKAKQWTASRVYGFAPRITMRQKWWKNKGPTNSQWTCLSETYRCQAPRRPTREMAKTRI